MKKISSLFLIAAFLFFPVWAQAEDKIRGKYEVIGDINKLKNIKETKRDAIGCIRSTSIIGNSSWRW